ncbi:ABC transporter ATP-binding protein [Paenibacillus aceti]|uniref:Daunorubicin ABC transporter ATP-binding protein n=1 Tax=Paenibacillus aceti TaxID=1820010 RepID=A0ABQ1W2S0_9BACL|nr:ATP-binding cassette domain-containing protein [Paenibacillus aceti]GGG09111.1 daunorubicin ABC transporter ATP-binding protein [Paenibacillus aceti]
MIRVDEITREYRQWKRYAGLMGSIRGLFSREYTTINAVNQVSFTIDQGEAVGYIGPNGAGKSTMIKMLTGILVPTAGELTVNNLIPHMNRKEIAKHIGIVFGQRSQLWWDLPVSDSFELHKRIYHVSDEAYRKNMDIFMELLNLKAFISQPVRQLSLGQRMRAEIGLALLHDPEIIFLDEPTIGLDVVAKDSIRSFLKYINKERNATIFLTSHDLKDIEEICPRLLIVNQGKLIFDGAVRDFKANISSGKLLTIEFQFDPGTLEFEDAILIADEGARKMYKIEKGLSFINTFIGRISEKYIITDFSLQDYDIEQVIRMYYQGLESESDLQGDLSKVVS